MKNIHPLLLITFLLFSCAPAATESSSPMATMTATLIPAPSVPPSLTPTPTFAPCPDSYYGSTVRVYFDKVEPRDCAQYMWVVSKMDAWINEQGLSTGPAEIHVFGKIEDVANFEITQTIAWKMVPPSLNDAIAGWQSGGGNAFPCVAMFTTDPASWAPKQDEGEQIRNTIHEMVHLIQYSLFSDCKSLFPFIPNGSIPNWWVEGEAEYNARSLAQAWGETPDAVDIDHCLKFSLSDLNIFNEENSSCVYNEGEGALIYLAQQYGSRDLEIWQYLRKGLSFNASFLKLYGVTFEQFNKNFESYWSKIISIRVDESVCKGSVSSGDFTMKCLGRLAGIRLVQAGSLAGGNQHIVQYEFNVSGFNLNSGPLDQLGVLSTCELIGWERIGSTILVVDINSKSVSKNCTITMAPHGSNKSAQVSFLSLGFLNIATPTATTTPRIP